MTRCPAAARAPQAKACGAFAVLSAAADTVNARPLLLYNIYNKDREERAARIGENTDRDDQ